MALLINDGAWSGRHGAPTANDMGKGAPPPERLDHPALRRPDG